MKELKTYKIIVQYTESAAISKKFKVEYVVEALDRIEAKRKAEAEFDSYSLNSNASWIRTMDESSIRIWRMLPQDPTTPHFIDELIAKLPGNSQKESLKLLKRLGELEDTTATSKIIALTKKDDPKIVAAAIYTLGKFLDPTSFFAVKNTYFQKPFPEVKLAVAETLYKLALPEDDIKDFYRTAIVDKLTREIVFKIENISLLPLWLSQISNEEEFLWVKETAIKLGEKSLIALSAIDIEDQPQAFDYASKLALTFKDSALEKGLADWNIVVNKYGL